MMNKSTRQPHPIWASLWLRVLIALVISIAIVLTFFGASVLSH